MSKNATRRTARKSPQSGPVCLHLDAENHRARRPPHEAIKDAYAHLPTLARSPFHRAPCPARPRESERMLIRLSLPQHSSSSTRRSGCAPRRMISSWALCGTGRRLVTLVDASSAPHPSRAAAAPCTSLLARDPVTALHRAGHVLATCWPSHLMHMHRISTAGAGKRRPARGVDSAEARHRRGAH